MTIFTPSESPGITVKEVDLTAVVRKSGSSTGAFVGNFRWGQVDVAQLVSDEADLVTNFASPDSANAVDFHAAASFLKYSSNLQVLRAVTSAAKNGYSPTEGASVPTVKNSANFDTQAAALDSAGHTFIAKYPGKLGNSLKVSLCPFDLGDSSFANWTYFSSFDAAPGTSSYASGRTATNDEVHVVVVDKNGDFTGTKGTVLERFPFLSLASNAKNTDGTTNYIKDVLNTRSRYVWLAGYDSDYTVAGAGTTADSGDNFALVAAAIKNVSLDSGVNSLVLGTSEIAIGFDKFEDVDTIKVDFLITPDIVTRVDSTTIVNDLVVMAGTTRKDCVVVASPPRVDVLGLSDPVTSSVAAVNTYTNSSYLIVDNNYLKVYDKYNDQYVFIPAASSTAGIMAAADLNSAAWFSPAGSRRGQYLGVTALSYSPTKVQRDTLYKAGINPIANIPGQGILLYGDKTKLARPSAFDRINVRRLFLVIERAIADAAKNVIFEFNDEFTRAEFVNIVEPFLREIQGRRGITEFRVVCDETNNTAAVIDRNEFIASVFIKPARSINYVTLNFVGVRTGVEFEEVVGIV